VARDRAGGHTPVMLLGQLLAAVALAAGPTGSLTGVAGPGGCIVPKQAPAAISCTRVRQLRFEAVLVSPDGRNLYTLGGIDSWGSAIAVMRRDLRTGAVHQLAGRQGCLVAGSTVGSCAYARLNNPTALFMTADGRELFYLNGAGSHPLNAYNRSLATGALSRVDCCDAVRGVACATDLATSPDGRNVYITSNTCTGHGLSILVRDPRSGELSQPEGEAGCIQRIGADGCARAPVTAFGPSEVAVTPDGAQVYVTDELTGGFFVFARDRGTGTLKSRACYLAKPQSPCDALSKLSPDLASVFGFALAPDGRNLYLLGHTLNPRASARILVLARSPSGELSQLAPPRGCVTANGDAGRCIAAQAPDGDTALTFSPDGRTLYDDLGALNRDPVDGSLSKFAWRYHVRCCTGFSPAAYALSPDGRFFYAPDDFPGRDVYGLRVLRRTR
jgi:hypothetical protein